MSFNPFVNGGGGTSSEDKVARAEIAAIKDGETLDSFSDVEAALSDKVDKETGKGLSTNDYTTAEKEKLAGIAEGAEVNEIQGIKVNSSTVNPDANKVVNITVPTSAADVSAIPDTTKYAAALSLTINSSTFVMTGQLKDQNGDNLGTAQTIDLPLESVVVGGSYNSQTKKVVLTLQNGNTIEFSVADLVSGLQAELSASNKLNPAYIDYDSTHRAVSDTEKSTWNGKQDALSSAQLNAVNSKMTRKQAITNGMYLVERQPKATTNPDTGAPYIYASFADYNHDFDSVVGITVTQFGIIYCNDGTVKVDELRLENVDGIHIIKKDNKSGSNLPVSGTNPVTAVGFAQYQDSDGVTSDVLYTNDIGGDYRLLNAPSDIVALQQTIGDINSVLEEVL